MVSRAWLVLFVAALFETTWAVGLGYVDGFRNLRATAAVVVAMAISVVLLSRAVETLPVGTAYAVWTGIGAVGTALAGIHLFDEPATAARLGCICLVVAGVAGLQITSGA